MQALDITIQAIPVCVFFILPPWFDSPSDVYVAVRKCCPEPHSLRFPPSTPPSVVSVSIAAKIFLSHEKSARTVSATQKVFVPQPSAFVPQSCILVFLAGSRQGLAHCRPDCCSPPSPLPQIGTWDYDAARPICLSIGHVPNRRCPVADRSFLRYDSINCDANDSLFYGQSPHVTGELFWTMTLINLKTLTSRRWAKTSNKKGTLLFEYITFLDLF